MFLPCANDCAYLKYTDAYDIYIYIYIYYTPVVRRMSMMKEEIGKKQRVEKLVLLLPFF
jgi:hypothetical protein